MAEKGEKVSIESHSSAVQLRKQLGLLNGVAMIVGIIVGSGIFVSPKGVLLEAGSVGSCLLVWAIAGVMCGIGAMCYAELGTCITASGADYSYIGHAFGGLPAFLYLWVCLVVIIPTGNAITALTFANYIIQPLFPSCKTPENLTSEAFVKQDILTSLKLDGNPLKTLFGSTFRNLYNLKEFRAKECSLTEIHDDVFPQMPTLTLIDLSLNRLKSAPRPGVFSEHKSLKNLILYHNVIEVLLTDNFNSHGLHTLDLSSNRINKIDQLAFRGSGITSLDLSHNSIISLDSSVFKELSDSVIHLNLASNPLRKLPPGLFSDLKSIENLNISKCSLEELNVNAFEGLAALKNLDLSYNNFHFLPESIFTFFNKISSISLEQNAWECDCKVKPLRDWIISQDRSSKLHCLSGGKNDTECSKLSCLLLKSGESKQISLLLDSELSECHSEHSSTLAAGTQGAIVASCMGFSIILLLFAIFLWKKGQTGSKLKKICVPSEAESSHVIDEDSKVPPLANCDRNSLTHSDHNFVFRHYFDHLVTDPEEIETTDEDELAMGEAEPLKQKDSLYSSQPSLYSHPTEAAYGMESTV
ncbi:hypothetical protein Btru_060930 [Bulinus truncatus]|nr:hypothetical protein Btru_060930 [Bulinus truncatus]